MSFMCLSARLLVQLRMSVMSIKTNPCHCKGVVKCLVRIKVPTED